MSFNSVRNAVGVTRQCVFPVRSGSLSIGLCGGTPDA